jgi:hypothetical protein
MTCCETEVSKSTYHCVKCCVTFGNLALFDGHQSRRGRTVYCHIPGGLVTDRWGVLRTPEDAASVEAKVDAMQAAKERQRSER